MKNIRSKLRINFQTLRTLKGMEVDRALSSLRKEGFKPLRFSAIPRSNGFFGRNLGTRHDGYAWSKGKRTLNLLVNIETNKVEDVILTRPTRVL